MTVKRPKGLTTNVTRKRKKTSTAPHTATNHGCRAASARHGRRIAALAKSASSQVQKRSDPA